jgi:hypothetical protein
MWQVKKELKNQNGGGEGRLFQVSGTFQSKLQIAESKNKSEALEGRVPTFHLL